MSKVKTSLFCSFKCFELWNELGLFCPIW